MAFIPSFWREIPQRYRYEGNRCKGSKNERGNCDCDCEGRIYFPPRRVCCPWDDCEMEPVALATTGKVLTYTIIHIPPDQFADEAPYALAVCEMDDGARLTAQVADCPAEELKIGMPVRVEFRLIQRDGEAGILMYGYKVVPAK
jgi:uncharacterized OB-fold protein